MTKKLKKELLTKWVELFKPKGWKYSANTDTGRNRAIYKRG